MPRRRPRRRQAARAERPAARSPVRNRRPRPRRRNRRDADAPAAGRSPPPDPPASVVMALTDPGEHLVRVCQIEIVADAVAQDVQLLLGSLQREAGVVALPVALDQRGARRLRATRRAVRRRSRRPWLPSAAARARPSRSPARRCLPRPRSRAARDRPLSASRSRSSAAPRSVRSANSSARARS